MNQNEKAVIDEYRSHLPVDINGLIENLNVTFEESKDLDSEISGEIERLSSDKFVIRVNARHAETRKRFTAAHELGHYILHRALIGKGVDDNKAYRSEKGGNFHNTNITQRHETEANQFAAVVLMPSNLVRSEFAQNPSVEALAYRFGVSQQAMRIRLSSLNLSSS